MKHIETPYITSDKYFDDTEFDGNAEYDIDKYEQDSSSVLYTPECLDDSYTIVRLGDEEQELARQWASRWGRLNQKQAHIKGMPRRIAQYMTHRSDVGGCIVDPPRDDDIYEGQIITQNDVAHYMHKQTDIRSNQIIMLGTNLIATNQAIEDISRNHYAPTLPHDFSPKVALKMLLLTAEHITHDEEATYDQYYVQQVIHGVMDSVERPRDLGKVYKKAMKKAAGRGEKTAEIFKDMIWQNIRQTPSKKTYRIDAA